MAVSKNTKPKWLYYSAKISDYRFRKVLSHYVRDHSATRTAGQTRLSINSVASIFHKLRVYFTEVGLFTDYYNGQDPREFKGDNEGYEFALLDYHLGRVREKRGLKSPPDRFDHHFAESRWRFDYLSLMRNRPSEEIYAMMQSHLLEIIRACGPIGRKPRNISTARLIRLRQMDQRILWLERNAPDFRSPSHRAALREIRNI